MTTPGSEEPSVPHATDRTVVLRPATAADMALIFAWRNRPEIVALSTSQRIVTWEEHVAWYKSVLANPNRMMLLIEHLDRPVGQIRFDRVTPAECNVTIYLLPEYTGKGLGVRALRSGCAQAFAAMLSTRILAYIRS